MDHRATLSTLAHHAANDPAHASVYARVVLDQIAAWKAEGGEPQTPPGYLYAGARSIVVRADRLAVEPLPEEPPAIGGGPGGVAITTTGNDFVQAKMPVDALIYGVSGYAIPNVLLNDNGAQILDTGELFAFSAASDGRDLFSAQWNVDGETQFTTDGTNSFMTPAAALVGTRLRPRALAWKLKRDQTIGVRFRNLYNAIVGRTEEQPDGIAPTINCALVFYALDLRRLEG